MSTHDNALIDFLPSDKFGAEWDAQYLINDSSNFEGGTVGTWAANTNANSITNTTATPFRGTRCLQWLVTSNGTSRISNSVRYGLGRIVAGRNYTVRGFFRPPLVGRTCAINVDWYNSGGSYLSTTTLTGISCGGDVYTKFEGTHTSPANAAQMSVVLEVQGATAGQSMRVDDIQFEDKHIDITNLVREYTLGYGRNYITDQFETGTLSITANSLNGEFDSDYLGTTNAIQFIGAGSSSTVNNGSTTPSFHGFTTVNDFLLMVDVAVSSTGTPSNVTIPAGWNLITQFNRDGAASPRIAILYKYFATGDIAPTVQYLNGAANDTHISQIASFRNVHLTDPVPVISVPGSNGTATDIGPIPGLVMSYNGGAVVFVGARGDDWTSVATLSGDSLTWAEIGEPDTTSGDDGGVVWDYALVPSAPIAISNKTFSVTGGSGPAVGVGLGLKPQTSVSTAYAGSGQMQIQTQVRIRVQAPAQNGNARVIYPGMIANVESIVQEWDVGNKETHVTIQGADLLRILQNGTVPPTIEDMIANNNPLMHFPLMEVANRAVNPKSLGNDPSLTPAWYKRKAGMTARVTGLMLDAADLGTRFTGPNSTVDYADSEYGGLMFGENSNETSNALLQTPYLNNWTMGFWFKANSNSGTSLQDTNMLTMPNIQLSLHASSGAGGAYDQLKVHYMSGGSHLNFTACSITAGTSYFIILTKDSNGIRCYRGTASAAPTLQSTFGPSGNLDTAPWDPTYNIWGINTPWGPPYNIAAQARFDMAQFFMLPTVLNVSAMNDFWKYSSVMSAQEDTGVRLYFTILNYTQIPAGRRQVDNGKTTLATSRRRSGMSLLQYAQALNSTELGLLYCNGEGVIVFENRDYLPLLSTVSITLGEGVGEVPYTAEFQPSLDIENTFTRVVVSREILGLDDDGGASNTTEVHQKDADSTLQARYGIRSHEQMSWTSNGYEADDIAQYLLNVLSMTSRRVSSVTITPDRNQQWPEIMERKIGDKILIKRRPNYYANGYYKVYQIESISMHGAPGATTDVTWSLSPVWTPAGYLPDAPGGIPGPLYWILGTSVLDTNTYLGY